VQESGKQANAGAPKIQFLPEMPGERTFFFWIDGKNRIIRLFLPGERAGRK
jgi:hypothetical protein